MTGKHDSTGRYFNRHRTGILIVIAIATLSIGLLLNRGILWDIAIPITTLSVSSILLLFLLREQTTRSRIMRQEDDIHEKVRQLEESNRLLKLTEARAHVGHWRLDLKTNEVFWSEETARIHGLDPGSPPPPLDEAINLFYPDDRVIVEGAVETARSSGEPFTFRARLLRPDGGIRHVESIAQLEFEDDEPSALFGVLADRTEEEAMQQELRDARNEAAAMAEAKTSFLAKMSHEIRTPMNGVIGFAELLSMSKLAPEQRRHADLIVESGKALQTLLNDILDLTKIDAGEFEIRNEPTNLRNVVNRIASMFEPLAREKAIDLNCHLAEDLPHYITIDGLRLRQILSNLLSNAVRFTDEGEVELVVRSEGQVLEFKVKDTGTGIEKRMLDAIFDPFTQDAERPEKRQGGTGLGLAISRQLSELMGGRLTVESTPDEGSEFTVRLPLLIAEAPAREQHKRASDQPIFDDPCAGCRCRILLVEDYDINQELICDMGRKIGLNFEVAVDGEDAIAKVLTARDGGRPYSLVLMDLQMPKMGGLEATRVIRESGIDEETMPIIALTANAFADDADACLAAGMQQHISKPLELSQLRDAMRRWLKGYAKNDTATPSGCGAAALMSKPLQEAGSSGSRQYCRRF